MTDEPTLRYWVQHPDGTGADFGLLDLAQADQATHPDSKMTMHFEGGPTDNIQQFGNLKKYPRRERAAVVAADGIKWAIGDYLTKMQELGVDPIAGLPTLDTFYIAATSPLGGSHSDPLAQRKTAYAHDHQMVGWKVSLEFETPETGSLEEGSRPWR